MVTTSRQKKKIKIATPPKVSYHRKPEDFSLEQWQVALRRQFAEKNYFSVENIGGQAVFSDYHVFNPETNNTYKVAIRSAEPGLNFCSCMDFKTNGLGTCKHIEFVLYRVTSNPRNAKILRGGYQPHYTSVYLHYGNERTVYLRIGTEKADDFKKLSSKFFDRNNALKENAFANIEIFLQKAHKLHPDFRCYTDALEFILNRREQHERNEMVDAAVKKGNLFYKELLHASLFPYQKEGIEFLLRTGRCLLADDMGLGKTIQAIGAAEGMKKMFGISKVLIVCPTSLKYQWKSEIEKFTGSSLRVIEGNIFQRRMQYDNEEFYKICSYNVVGRDIEVINKSGFDLVILDEAQRIKNWQTSTAKNVKRIKTKYAFVLTGTPLENKLEELYSVVQMVDPFSLGALFRFLHEYRITDDATGKIIGYKKLNEIGGLLRGCMIRRHKKEVLTQLPSRMDKNLFVPMTEGQLEYYNDAFEKVSKLVNKWAKYKFLSEGDRQKLLINLNIMRMACDSTFIVDEKTRHDTKIDELMNILDEVFENSNDKVVVFSQWERMTRLVAQELDNRKIKFENLNGSIPSRDREQLFKNFNNNPESRVFLSTDAGSVGLNLQSASLLINLDLPWNPAVLEQRISRIHRMGQKKNVQIINLIAKDTIEEQMLDKLRFKSAMASGILDNGESTVFLGESKFNELMKNVQQLTENASLHTATIAEEPKNDFVPAPPAGETQMSGTNNQTALLFDDDIIKSENNVTRAVNETEDLLQSGAGFFSKLLSALSDKSKTEQLLNVIVKTDSSTGQTYLQIPVKNTEIVENGLKLLGQLLSGIK